MPIKHNAHVYKWLRWKAFCAQRNHQQLRAFVLQDMAREEVGMEKSEVLK